MNEPTETNGVWMTCKHVIEGSATEVWARQDGIAVCKQCAQIPDNDVENIPHDQLATLCVACLLEKTESVFVRCREFIEQDAIRYGHQH
jgi:hypothetical protein